MATRALSALPPTFPAPGVAAAIHRAVTAAAGLDRKASRGGRLPVSLDVAGAAAPVAEAEPGRPSLEHDRR